MIARVMYIALMMGALLGTASYADVVWVSQTEKVEILFKLFDVDPRNGYLGFTELHLFQHLTDPQLPLDMRTYVSLTKILGSGRTVGLTMQEFNSSYFRFKHELGTDLDRDFAKIVGLVRALRTRAA